VLLLPLADHTVRHPGGLLGVRAPHPIVRASLHRATSDVSRDVDVDAVAERVEVDAEPLAGRD
jgi:hypothetical protein